MLPVPTAEVNQPYYPHSVNGLPLWGEEAEHYDYPLFDSDPCQCSKCLDRSDWWALYRVLTDGKFQFEVSESKQNSFTHRTSRDLARWEFFHPTLKMCQCIVVDIDRATGRDEILELLPLELAPSALIQTRKGWQAFWAIEAVWLPGNSANVGLLKHVGYTLRKVLAGDPAVDPIQPYKVRNPLYAGVRAVEYVAPGQRRNLGVMRDLLRGIAGLSEQYRAHEREHKSTMRLFADCEADFADLTHHRNEAVFRLVLKAARKGMSGQELDNYAVELAGRCNPPLPVQETHGMARRCEGYAQSFTARFGGEGMDKTEISPEARQWLSEIGAKGGSRKTIKQKEALAKGSRAGNAVKSAQAIGRKAQIRALKEAGYNNTQIAQKMGLSRRTVIRALAV